MVPETCGRIGSQPSQFQLIRSSFPIKTSIQTFPLSQANEAMSDFQNGNVQGAAVLVMP